MKNLFEWTAVCILCLVLGFSAILWPLMAMILWNPLWLLDIPGMTPAGRISIMAYSIVCGFVVYAFVRYGYKSGP